MPEQKIDNKRIKKYFILGIPFMKMKNGSLYLEFEEPMAFN